MFQGLSPDRLIDGLAHDYCSGGQWVDVGQGRGGTVDANKPTGRFIYFHVLDAIVPKISEARRAEVRGRILDAARHLVASRGVQGTTMNEIVRASGLSKGAVYGHFPSKANLVVALQDQVLESRLQGAVLQFRVDESARERLLQLTRRLFEPGTPSNRERARLTLQFTASALQSPSLRAQVDARYERVHRLFRDLLEEGRHSGEFRPDLDASATATAILGLLDGLRVDWAFTSQLRLDPERLFPTVERLLCAGILNRGEADPPFRSDASPRDRRTRAETRASHRAPPSELP